MGSKHKAFWALGLGTMVEQGYEHRRGSETRAEREVPKGGEALSSSLPPWAPGPGWDLQQGSPHAAPRCPMCRASAVSGGPTPSALGETLSQAGPEAAFRMDRRQVDSG